MKLFGVPVVVAVNEFTGDTAAEIALVKKGAEIIFCPSSWAREDSGIGLRHDKQAEVKLIDSLSVGRARISAVSVTLSDA